jgi:hypothetical protein
VRAFLREEFPRPAAERNAPWVVTLRVKVKVSASCHDSDYSVSIRRARSPFYVWVSPARPFRKVLYPTFANADECSFTVFVDGGHGRLTSWLFTP